MKTIKQLLLILCVFLGMTAQAQENETKVLIKTNYGDITVKLYNDTPKHRDNFINLVTRDGITALLSIALLRTL